MAKTEYDIQDHKARAELEPRAATYWHKVQTNRFVGFQRLKKTSPGNWKARIQSGRSEVNASFGALEQHPAKDRYAEARKLAQAWFDEQARVADSTTALPSRITLDTVLKEYVVKQGTKRKNGASAARAADLRFLSILYPFADPASPGKRWVDKPLAKITAAEFMGWREWMEAMKAKSGKNAGKLRTVASIHRDLNFVIAALNLAHAKHGIPARWKTPLAKSKGDELQAAPKRGKEVYVEQRDRVRLLAAAAKVKPAAVPFLKAIMVLPIRPGALAGLSVRNYDADTHNLHIPLGGDKVNSNRDIGLSRDAVAVFDEAARVDGKVAKLPTAALFTDANGKRWNSNSWNRAIKASAKEAGLPAALTIYWLRHTRITDLVNKGKVPPMAVADMAGTSVQIIETHYFQHTADMQRDALQRVAAF